MDPLELAADFRVPDDEIVEMLLTIMVERRWLFHYLGADPLHPNAIAAKQEWPTLGYADLVILHGHLPDDAIAYRAPLRDDQGNPLDPFAPDWTVHHYRSNPRWTLQYALTLPPPTDLEHLLLHPAPAFCGIDRRDRRPMTIRPARSHLSLPPGWLNRTA